MAFDILGYHKQNKDLYGDASLEDVAKDVFSKGGYDKEYPDYDTWKKAKGIDSIIQENSKTPRVSETSNEESSLLRRGVRDPLLGLTKGLVVGVPETIMGLADIPTLGRAGKLAEEGVKAVGLKTFKEANEMFDERLSPEAQLSKQKVAETKGFIPTIKTAVENPSSIVQTVMESLMPMFVGGKGLGLLFGVGAKGLSKAEQLSRATLAGGISEGAITTGQGLEQVRQETPEGVLTPGQVGLGITAGAVTGVLGVLGGKIANRLGINDINTMLAGGTQQKTKIIKSLFAGALQEGLLEELPQSMQEQIFQNLSLDKPPLEGVSEAGAMGLLAGIAQSMGATSLGKAREQFTTSKTNNPDYNADVERLKLGADLVGIMHTGLTTGKINDTPFAPQDAMDIINQGRTNGTFDDHDISVFKDLFPQLRDNLNQIIADSVIEKVKVSNISEPIEDSVETSINLDSSVKPEISVKSEISIDPYRDMIPGAEKSYKKPNTVSPPKESEIWYRGQATGTTLSEDKPIFFTRDSNDAEWFKNERQVEGKGGEIHAASIKLSNPAHLRDLMAVVNETKSTAEDIQSNSPYDGENIVDYLYVPKVREELKKKGFDGFVGFDTLENKSIEIAVPFNLTSVTSKSQGMTNIVSDLQTQLIKQYPKSGLSLSTLVLPDSSVGITLNSLRLSENERGQGTGTKIVGQIKEYADKNKLKVEVHPQSQLTKFYEKQGFVKEREGVWTYQTPSKSAKVKATPVKVAPVKVAPVKVTPVKVATVKVAPVKVTPVKVATVKVEVPVTHILPKELHQAKPRYSYGSNQFNLAFENDLDKAAYITAQNTKSKSDEAYVQFVRTATGLSDMAIRSYGQKVKDHIKSVARSAVNGSELKIPNIGKDILAKSKVEEPKKPKIEEPKKPKIEEPKKPKVEEPKKPKVEEPKKPKVEESKKSKKPKYKNSLQNKTDLPLITLKEVQDIFKGQEVIQPGGINSPIYIKTSGGQYLTIESVTQITPNEMAFEIAYGRPYDPDVDFLAGVYESGTIQLVRGSTGKLELSHESVHYMEDAGIINKNEISLLQRHIQNLVKEGKFDTVNKEDIGGPEDRANFLADELTKDKPQGLLGRIILKIQDFIDKLTNAFGNRTVKGITRDIESGKIYEREGVTPDTEKTPASYPQYAAQQKQSKSPTLPWDVDPPSRIDKFLRVFTDRFIDLRRVIGEISKLHGQLADAQDPSLQQILYSAKVKDGIDHFLRDELRPLLRELQEKGGTLEGLHEFILNRHAPEANAYIASINPRLPDEGSGIKTQDAIDYMKNLSPTDKIMYDSLAKRYDAIAKKNLQLLVSNGLESQKTINTWLSKYQYYAPLYRSDMEKDGGFGTGRGFSVVGPSSKTRRGSTREVSNVIASLAEQRERYLTRIAKNNIDKAIVTLAEKYPNADFWSLAQPSITSKVSADPATKGQMVKVVDLSYMHNDNVIMSRSIDPKTGDIVQRGVEFHLDNERAKEMVKALKNLDMDKLGMVLGMSAKVTRFISSMNTQYNIVFGIVNFVRDFQAAMFNLSTTAIAGKQAEVANGVFPALQAIYKDLRAEHTGHGGVIRTQLDQDWQDFRAHGGLVGYRDMYRDRNDRINAIKNEMAKVSAGATKQVGHYIAQWLSDYNTTIEAGIRLSAYRVGIQNGLSKDRAAAMAKNLTLDFNKKGQISLQAGALYAFFNATAQGGVRLYETLAGPMGKKIIAGGIMVGVLQALMIAASDLDDNEPPEYVRERAIVIPIGNKKYLTIPMALGFHILPGIGRITTEWALGGFERPTEKFSNLLGTFIESFNPMGSAGMTLQTISPSPMDPIVALAENKDWTGRPIFKEDMNKLQPTPGFSRAKDAASGFSRSISWALNRLSGGSEYNPGFFSPTPDQIDYLAGQIGGGVTREAIKTVQAIGNIGEKESLPSHKLPLISRFYGSIDDVNHEKTQYYNHIKRFNEYELEIKGRRKEGKPVQDYIKDHPESRFVNIANKIDADITKLKKKKKILTDRGAEKEVIERIDNAIILYMKRLNDTINARK